MNAMCDGCKQQPTWIVNFNNAPDNEGSLTSGVDYDLTDRNLDIVDVVYDELYYFYDVQRGLVDRYILNKINDAYQLSVITEQLLRDGEVKIPWDVFYMMIQYKRCPYDEDCWT